MQNSLYDNSEKIAQALATMTMVLAAYGVIDIVINVFDLVL